MTRDEAIVIAKRAAWDAEPQPSYVPVQPTAQEWADWMPHEWVIDAVMKAAQARWLPIETAPKDGRSILLFEQHEDVPIVGYWWTNRGWRADKSVYDTDGDACVIDKICQENVTHWMPLPASPEVQP